MAALRILHVAPYFERAWAYGGIPRVVASQAHALAAAGHRVTVATTDARTATQRLEPLGEVGRDSLVPALAPRADRTADGIDVRVFPNVSNAAAYRWQLFLPPAFATFVRSRAREFDVVHLHACHNLLTALGARHLRRAGVPYVVQPNGTAPLIEGRRAAKAAFDRLFARGVLPNAAALIAVTEWERRQLTGMLAAASGRGADGAGSGLPPVHVVPNPLEPLPACGRPDRASFRERYSLSDSPLVTYLGMLTPRKNPDVLARAVAELGRQNVQLVFAGNDRGAGRRTRDAVHKLGLESRTRFTGLLAGPARYAALAAADVVVYPSRDEVFGLVPLEALQVGTPVVVCNDSGCGEIIGSIGGGLQVPPRDAGALAAATARILDNLPRWREEAARAGAEASRRFHPSVVAAQLENVYRAAAARA